MQVNDFPHFFSSCAFYLKIFISFLSVIGECIRPVTDHV